MRATYREVLAEPRFRTVLGSRSLSISAETLRILALSVLVFSRTGSPLLGAVAFGAGFLPQAFGGVLLGALADRLPARRLITGGYLLETVVALILAWAPLPVGGCLGLVAALACLTPVLTGASGRLVARSLTGDGYVLGRSLLTMSSSAAQLIGLAAGGIAVGALGPRQALVGSALANLLAAVWTRLALPADPATAPGGSVVRESFAGSVHLLQDSPVLRLLLIQWLPPTLLTGAEALLVPYAGTRGLPGGSAGALLAAVPIGMLLGGFLVGRFVPPDARERLVPALLALGGVPLLGFLGRPPFVAVLGLLVVAGAAQSYELGVQRRFLAALPEGRQGQGFTILSTGLMTWQGLGPIGTGGLAEWTGPAVAIAASGLLVILFAGVTAVLLKPPVLVG